MRAARRRGRRARRSSRCAGGWRLPAEALGRAGIRRAYPLTDVEPDVAKCIAEAGPILERVAERIARDFLA